MWPLCGHKQMRIVITQQVLSALSRDARSASDRGKPFFTVLVGTGREGLDSSKGPQVQILSARPCDVSGHRRHPDLRKQVRVSFFSWVSAAISSMLGMTWAYVWSVNAVLE